MTSDLLTRLRDASTYTPGVDLAERMQHAECIMAEMRQALADAISEIERLRAELQEQQHSAVG